MRKILLSNYLKKFWYLFFRWTTSKFGCVFSAYVMYFVGCMQIFSMAAISFERYYILKFHSSNLIFKTRAAYKMVFGFLTLSLFWSTAPLLGWSYYSLEDGQTHCSVEWKTRNLNVFTYNLAMFLFVFIVPFTLICFYNSKSILIVNIIFSF